MLICMKFEVEQLLLFLRVQNLHDALINAQEKPFDAQSVWERDKFTAHKLNFHTHSTR